MGVLLIGDYTRIIIRRRIIIITNFIIFSSFHPLPQLFDVSVWMKFLFDVKKKLKKICEERPLTPVSKLKTLLKFALHDLVILYLFLCRKKKLWEIKKFKKKKAKNVDKKEKKKKNKEI